MITQYELPSLLKEEIPQLNNKMYPLKVIGKVKRKKAA